MPRVNRNFQGSTWQDFVQTSPDTGIVRVQNDGAFHVYIRDEAINTEYKVIVGSTMDVPVVQGRRYTILVCGDVSIFYTLIPA